MVVVTFTAIGKSVERRAGYGNSGGLGVGLGLGCCCCVREPSLPARGRRSTPPSPPRLAFPFSLVSSVLRRAQQQHLSHGGQRSEGIMEGRSCVCVCVASSSLFFFLHLISFLFSYFLISFMSPSPLPYWYSAPMTGVACVCACIWTFVVCVGGCCVWGWDGCCVLVCGLTCVCGGGFNVCVWGEVIMCVCVGEIKCLCVWVGVLRRPQFSKSRNFKHRRQKSSIGGCMCTGFPYFTIRLRTRKTQLFYVWSYSELKFQ